MPDLDTFATLLLEEAKRFLEIAIESDNEICQGAYLHAALMVGFSALEAHINAMCEEFSIDSRLTVHERAVLLEKDVKLDEGEFRLSGFKMARLEDRMALLHKKFSGNAIDKQSSWWSSLKSSIDLRNRLTHPKGAHSITIDGVKTAITSIINAVDVFYMALYKQNFPAAVRVLQSKLTF